MVIKTVGISFLCTVSYQPLVMGTYGSNWLGHWNGV